MQGSAKPLSMAEKQQATDQYIKEWLAKSPVAVEKRKEAKKKAEEKKAARARHRAKGQRTKLLRSPR